jgi:iron(III) transport system substrate-binding protein
MEIWNRTKTLALATLLAGAAFLHQAVAGEITVYSALEEEEINLFVEKAKEEIPDIKINVLRCRPAT